MPRLEICISLSNELQTIVRPLRSRTKGRREAEEERGVMQKRARRAKTRARARIRARTRANEGKSCNEDSTSIESDKAACAAPAAFNEHSALQPRSAGPFDEYLLLRTRYSIPFR